MKTKKVIKLWSKHNLPQDLLPEILSRLPVKSLLRFRCVSKSWRSLIDDPNFCSLHLNTFKNNCNETHFFVVQYSTVGKQNYVVRCSNTFKTTMRLDYLETVNGSSQTFETSPIFHCGWKAICSIDGLVMLKHHTREIELVMWNPSIRRARTLPPSPVISKGIHNVDLGFGFNPLIQDYQHVRFVQCGEINLPSVAVYTFGANSWKTIKFQGKGISNWRWSFAHSFGWKTVCLRGVIYFTPFKPNRRPRELVSFDLSQEVFSSTCLPAEDNLKSKHHVDKALMLVDDGSSLGMIYYVRGQGIIWVLESSEVDVVSKWWTKRYTFTSGSFLCFKHLKKNGEMILMYRKMVTSYNLATREEKTLLTNSRGLIMTDVWDFKESLLMLNA